MANTTTREVLVQAVAASADHLAKVRGTSFEAVAKRDLDTLCALLLDA